MMPCVARGRHPLTWKELRSQLDYDKETGHLAWLVSKPRIRVGQRAGSDHVKGHREITVCGFTYREHRLIWWWVTGKDPGDKYVDHKNRRRNDNRWKNLRPATHGQNYVNSMQFGKMRGICRHGAGYRVRIGINGKRPTFHVKTYLAAKRLRNKLERQYYGEFSCTRK